MNMADLFVQHHRYSQFWPRLWGWKPTTAVPQKSGKTSIGIFWGSILGVIITIGIVLVSGNTASDEGRLGWAWIDVVSQSTRLACARMRGICQPDSEIPTDQCHILRQAASNSVQIHPASNLQFPSKINSRVQVRALNPTFNNLPHSHLLIIYHLWNSIWQVLLDFSGGLLSLLQLVIDSALQSTGLRGVTNNPLKFGLANISMLFDVIFMVQHYVLFGPVEKRGTEGEEHGRRDSAARSGEEAESLLPTAGRG